VERVPSYDHLLELDNGRTIGYATWGDPSGSPVFIGHGTPGSRLDRYAALDDPEWLGKRRLRFIGVDRPGYGYSDPWPEASLLDCSADFVRVAEDLGLERFWALGVSGGAPYVIALGALAPERVGRVAVVSGAHVRMDEEETQEELAAELGEEARMLRDDPDEWYAGLAAEVTEVDRRVLERPEVRAIAIEMFQEAVRQGAVGWQRRDLLPHHERSAGEGDGLRGCGRARRHRHGGKPSRGVHAIPESSSFAGCATPDGGA
jgi:pimeloyl-ACP methyl ester carboxylesterase